MIDHLVDLCEKKQKELLKKKSKVLQKINSVKGMKDLFGEELIKHQYLSQIFRNYAFL